MGPMGPTSEFLNGNSHFYCRFVSARFSASRIFRRGLIWALEKAQNAREEPKRMFDVKSTCLLPENNKFSLLIPRSFRPHLGRDPFPGPYNT